MQDKLEAVREELGGKKYDIGDETVSEVLREGELCLTNIIRRIRANDDERKRAELTGSVSHSSADGGDASPFKGGEDDNINSMRPYNQRINLADDEDGDFMADDGGGPDMDDEELTRDKVKRASTQILQAVDRRKRRAKDANAKKAKTVGGEGFADTA